MQFSWRGGTSVNWIWLDSGMMLLREHLKVIIRRWINWSFVALILQRGLCCSFPGLLKRGSIIRPLRAPPDLEAIFIVPRCDVLMCNGLDKYLKHLHLWGETMISEIPLIPQILWVYWNKSLPAGAPLPGPDEVPEVILTNTLPAHLWHCCTFVLTELLLSVLPLLFVTVPSHPLYRPEFRADVRSIPHTDSMLTVTATVLFESAQLQNVHLHASDAALFITYSVCTYFGCECRWIDEWINKEMILMPFCWSQIQSAFFLFFYFFYSRLSIRDQLSNYASLRCRSVNASEVFWIKAWEINPL